MTGHKLHSSDRIETSNTFATKLCDVYSTIKRIYEKINCLFEQAELTLWIKKGRTLNNYFNLL